MRERRPRHWFQVSLRTLLAIVPGFGLGLAVNMQFRQETRDEPDPGSIRRGDRLTLEYSSDSFVTNFPRRTVEVLSDGCVRLPELRQVPAAGMSLDELTGSLNERYCSHYSSVFKTKIEVNVFISFENTSVEEHRSNGRSSR
jgi:hypothetical protein